MAECYAKCTVKLSQNVRHCRCVRAIVLLILFLCAPLMVASAEAGNFDTSKDNWAIISGYGQSIPDWGQTTQRVETIELIPRYNHHIFDNLGSGWYHGFHSIMVELPVSLIVSPEVSSMVGMNFLASYTFTSGREWQPYLFLGGGPVYSFADISGMGAKMNGNYQFGVGIKFDWDTTHQLLFELRHHHVSNAGTRRPNEPLNSVKVLIGFTF